MMRKGKGYRGPKRRGFDDDGPFPDDFRGGGGGSGGGGGGPGMRSSRPFGNVYREPPAPEGPAVDASVKWFNPEKGFGFAELADGSGDAFLHVAILQAAGLDSVAPGAKMKVNVGQGAKGPQITRVLEVDESAAAQPAPSRSGGPGGRVGGGRPSRRTVDMSSATEMSGTVKWFNSDKGFGFVACEDGGKDVFVHATVLAEAGLPPLAEGQAVSMRVIDTPKGREAVSIALG